ncbi:MAG: hypothetical protein QG630_57 [Patescibacteria group bacterium]|nr:hypothetical protein [Patescibacteria group bacterium]
MTYNYKKLFIPARNLRNVQTVSEKKIWSLLKNKQINNFRFLRQKILGEFIVDFYCHELKLIIEIDGGIHNKQKERDKEREEYLKNKFDLRILRYSNEFILENNIDFLKQKVQEDINVFI